MNTQLFTSESVCAGHPDKVCDQISDAIVDEVLRNDPNGRAAIETMASADHLAIVGEISTHADINFEKIARKQIKRLGYSEPAWGFSDKSPITTNVHAQSGEIAAGVKRKGAGDQGMMFGYACKETKELMPLPITLAHALARKMDTAREKKILPYLRPDGKTQVTIAYENGKPIGVKYVVLAVPHDEDVPLNQVTQDLYQNVVLPTLEKYGFSYDIKDLIVNGTGIWHMGGPASDSGLTGRKIVVDTYGGYARVGGGAFSGKDPTKVDRSGAYAARFLAKNIVAHTLADRAEVYLAYYIGAKKPIMQEVETFGTEKTDKKTLIDFMHKLLDTSVEGIIDGLDLRRPIYLPTAAYGHFGRKEFPWEKVVKGV